MMRRLLLVYIVICAFGGKLHGQSIYSGDCDGAIPIINGYYDIPVIDYPINSIPNEINPFYSCLASGEVNAVWFEFLILDSGMLSFNIIPYVATTDLDWGLMDITNSTCSNIYDSLNLEVRCNYSNSITNTGITGANGGPNDQDEPTLNVVSGQRFKLVVSNFSGTTDGFQINMVASTCVFDQTVGILENEIGTKIKIGPNPSQGLINITFDHTILGSITDMKIIDLLGKTILQKSSDFSPLLSFDLSNQPAGLYFIQISTQTEQHSFRLIVQ